MSEEADGVAEAIAGERASEFRSDRPPPVISSAVATGSAASVNVPAMAHPPL
jgi:hypothetical protein